ncbi:hypothetical protein BHE74_00003441 [Ensete ventricosum]|nr:hypothetical protein BHE74_00003441 [Ensete ventricosum]
MKNPWNDMILLLPLQEFMSLTSVQGKLRASAPCLIFYVDSLHAAWILHQVPPKLLRKSICNELMVALAPNIPQQINGGVCVSGFSVPRLEGSVSCCCVGRRNRYCGSLGGSDGGSQALVVVVAVVAAEEGSRADGSYGRTQAAARAGKKGSSVRRETVWNKERREAVILVAWPAMLARAAAEGITRDCSNVASCRGGNTGWAVLTAKEENGSRGRSRGDWSGRQRRCGRRWNSGERTAAVRSCGCGRGLEMAASGRRRSRVGAVVAEWGLRQQRQGRWRRKGRGSDAAVRGWRHRRSLMGLKAIDEGNQRLRLEAVAVDRAGKSAAGRVASSDQRRGWRDAGESSGDGVGGCGRRLEGTVIVEQGRRQRGSGVDVRSDQRAWKEGEGSKKQQRDRDDGRKNYSGESRIGHNVIFAGGARELQQLIAVAASGRGEGRGEKRCWRRGWAATLAARAGTYGRWRRQQQGRWMLQGRGGDFVGYRWKMGLRRKVRAAGSNNKIGGMAGKIGVAKVG